MRIQSAVAALAVCCLSAVCSAETSLAAVRDAAAAASPWIIDVRRELHAIPEVLYNESATSTAVRRRLDELGVAYKYAAPPRITHKDHRPADTQTHLLASRYPYAIHGIVATIGSGTPIVALRADMDALPIQEPEGVAYRCSVIRTCTLIAAAADLF